MRPERFPTCQCVTCMCQRQTANKGRLCTRCLDQGHQRCEHQKRIGHIGIEELHPYHGHKSVVNDERLFGRERESFL